MHQFSFTLFKEPKTWYKLLLTKKPLYHCQIVCIKLFKQNKSFEQIKKEKPIIIKQICNSDQGCKGYR